MAMTIAYLLAASRLSIKGADRMRGSGLALAGSVALLVTLLHGCIVADLVDCGDGTACPRGTTCVAGACASPGQLTVCDGVSDGVSCIADRRTGACSGGVCTFALCGNQIVEPGEQCDDGNFVAGDGCTPDCKSNETCGNGVVDVNEQCDDGNLDDHDGCQSICVRQHCGDAIVDPGEVCDDGNLAAGDGCTPDCKSLEVCGNDVIDFFIAEVCDDGNTRNADGCAGTCQQHEARGFMIASTSPRSREKSGSPRMLSISGLASPRDTAA
jgi:cysteine-rich repeat protein